MPIKDAESSEFRRWEIGSLCVGEKSNGVSISSRYSDSEISIASWEMKSLHEVLTLCDKAMRKRITEREKEES